MDVLLWNVLKRLLQGLLVRDKAFKRSLWRFGLLQVLLMFISLCTPVPSQFLLSLLLSHCRPTMPQGTPGTGSTSSHSSSSALSSCSTWFWGCCQGESEIRVIKLVLTVWEFLGTLCVVHMQVNFFRILKKYLKIFLESKFLKMAL